MYIHRAVLGARTSHQELSEEVDLLEPECLLAIAIHKEVERLSVAVPPLVRVLSAAHIAAEHVPVPVKQGSEASGHPDGVEEDEDDCHNGICLVRVGVAVDSIVRAMVALSIIYVLAREAAEGGPAQDGIDEEEPADGDPDLRKTSNVGMVLCVRSTAPKRVRTARSRVRRVANAYCSITVPVGAEMSCPVSASVTTKLVSVDLAIDRRTHNRRPR